MHGIDQLGLNLHEWTVEDLFLIKILLPAPVRVSKQIDFSSYYHTCHSYTTDSGHHVYGGISYLM